MRIGLDVTPLAIPLAGIGTFTRELVHAIHRDARFELAPVAFTGRNVDEVRRNLPSGVALRRNVPARILHPIWRRFDWPQASQLIGPVDLLHGTNFTGIPTGGKCPELITIHDTGPWLRPDEVPPAARAFPVLAERAVRRGAHVHTLSYAAGEEIAELLSLGADRVHPIQIGFDAPHAEPVKPSGLGAPDGQPFLLVLGSLEPRKRTVELVSILRPILERHDHLNVVIAGDGPERGAVEAALATLGSNAGRVHLTGFVDRPGKSWLLRNALAVVSNAKAEGFGMVPLEAMAVGTPVVGTDGPAQREVCGDAALLTDPDSPADLAAAVEALIADDARIAAGAEAGRLQAARFSWERMGTEMTQLYRSLIG